LKSISEHHLRTVLGTRWSGCFQAKTAKTFFTDFFLDFSVNVFEFFAQDFLLLIWSKETIFGFDKIGKDYKFIIIKLYSPSNKSSIFRKWLILWRKSWAAFMSFYG